MPLSLAVALGLALLVGFSLGAVGSGGSIVALPALVYVAGVAPQDAVAMPLAIVGATALAGACLHIRAGNLHAKASIVVGAAGVAGAYLGSSLTRLVSAAALMLMFGLLMLVVGGLMLRQAGPTVSRERRRPVRCTLIGAGVGALTGFLGVGGGFLILPALLLAGIDTKKAVGASLTIICVNALSGLAGQLRYSHIDVALTAAFLAAALGGMFFGVRVATRLPEAKLKRVFAVFVVAVGVAMALGNL